MDNVTEDNNRTNESTFSRLLANEPLLFLGLPVLVFGFPHIFLITGGYHSWIMPVPRELGFVENFTAFMLLAAGIYGIYLSTNSRWKEVKLGRATLLFISLLSIWICLEEISYGQQYLHFDSPEFFIEKNFQKETNIHNLGGTKLSHTLKTAGYIGVSLAGILLPLFVRFSGRRFEPTSWFYYFIPTSWIIAPSLFHLFANLPKQIAKVFPGGDLFVSFNLYFAESGEYEEYMFGLWVILYLAMVHRALSGMRQDRG